MTINGNTLSWPFYVVPDLTEEAVLGPDIMQAYNIRLDPEQ